MRTSPHFPAAISFATLSTKGVLSPIIAFFVGISFALNALVFRPRRYKSYLSASYQIVLSVSVFMKSDSLSSVLYNFTFALGFIGGSLPPFSSFL